MKYTRALFLAILALVALPMMGQIVTSIKGVERERINVDSIINDFDMKNNKNLPEEKKTWRVSDLIEVTIHNSDVKFQISFRHRLTKSILPFHSHLFLQYSQKAIWNVFEESLPFHDLNFNPGIGVQNLVMHNGRLVGNATIMLEHESNGRDGEASRSWNKVTFGYAAVIDPRLEVYAKTWIPIIDGQQNKDILKYCGIFQVGSQFISSNRRWVADVTFVKRQGWNLNFNTILNLGFRFSKRDNQYFMLHFYDGYGENLLDYNKYHLRLRIGILIRPDFFSDF